MMNKILNEDWQAFMLRRDWYAERSVVLVPRALARVAEWVIQGVSVILLVIGFGMIPIFAWWIACLILG